MSKPLVRSMPFELTREAVDGDGLTLEGHAAVFNSPTRIDSWEGTFDEQIAPGAFKKSIRENKPVLQFDHGRSALIGSLPLGVIEELREDSTGLFVQARLHDNWAVQPIRDAIASGAIHGMSFRFIVVKDEWRDAAGKLLTDPSEIRRLLYTPDPKGVLQRTLKEIKTPELGPVVFPAYADTTVAVRSDVAAILSDPDGLAELARAFHMLGTPSPSSDAAGASDEQRAATTTEPGDHSADQSADDEATRRAVAHARHRQALREGIHTP